MSHPLVALLTVHIQCVIGLWIYIYFAAFRGLFAEDKDLRHPIHESGEELESLRPISHHQTEPQHQAHGVENVAPPPADPYGTRAPRPHPAAVSPQPSRHSWDSSIAPRDPSIFTHYSSNRRASTTTEGTGLSTLDG
ncbi:hypothetical protein JCM5350_000252 [Sporobolomyces pararoseus]